MSTKDDLMAGFAGESMATGNMPYFQIRRQQKDLRMGTLFKAASLAEEIHARRHLQVYGIFFNAGEPERGY